MGRHWTVYERMRSQSTWHSNRKPCMTHYSLKARLSVWLRRWKICLNCMYRNPLLFCYATFFPLLYTFLLVTMVLMIIVLWFVPHIMYLCSAKEFKRHRGPPRWASNQDRSKQTVNSHKDRHAFGASGATWMALWLQARPNRLMKGQPSIAIDKYAHW